MTEETVQTILLQGEDGSEIECEFGDRFAYADGQYVIMIPYVDGRRDEDSVLLMEVVADDQEPDVEYLLPVDDLDRMNEIFSAYIQWLAAAQHEAD